MLPDLPEARKKFLRAFRVAKTTYATLALTCRLEAVFCAIVPPSCGFDEHNGMDAPPLTASMPQGALAATARADHRNGLSACRLIIYVTERNNILFVFASIRFVDSCELKRGSRKQSEIRSRWEVHNCLARLRPQSMRSMIESELVETCHPVCNEDVRREAIACSATVRICS